MTSAMRRLSSAHPFGSRTTTTGPTVDPRSELNGSPNLHLAWVLRFDRKSPNGLVSAVPCACGSAPCVASSASIAYTDPNTLALLRDYLTFDMDWPTVTALVTRRINERSGLLMGPEGQSSFITMALPTHHNLSRPTP